MSSKVAVIGAGGHVGLPLSLVMANAGHQVYGIDVNDKVVDQLNQGEIPYVEYGAKELLDKVKHKNIFFTCQPDYVQECDVVAIMLGTPVDEENNPRLDDLFSFIDNTLVRYMKKGTLVILRSTVSPGTTEVVRDRIVSHLGWREGTDFYLVFCPERVIQCHGIEETAKLPQLIGAFNDISFKKSSEFFNTFVQNEMLQLTPREAEVGKLMGNMYRYVNFALANEFWMIAEKQGVDIHKVIRSCNFDYPRMNMPTPGPNVGGPCLFKDGRFLLSDVPFADLIQVSFLINEGMPDYIFNRVKEMNPNIRNVLILGAAFKAGSDDIRNSLSYKMKKVCEKHGAKVFMIDPYVAIPEKHQYNGEKLDLIVVMTPHKEFIELYGDLKRRYNGFTIMVDIWKLFPESETSTTGIYRIEEIK